MYGKRALRVISQCLAMTAACRPSAEPHSSMCRVDLSRVEFRAIQAGLEEPGGAEQAVRFTWDVPS